MKCKNIVSLLTGSFVIKTKDNEYKYESKDQLDENIKNFDVNSVYAKDNIVIIEAKLNESIKSLEELGYSFEVGMSGQ